MAFEIPKQPYSGAIGEVTIGSGDGAVKLGGEDAFPFHLFEGNMPNPPKIAMEVWDYDPSEEWPASAVEAYRDVLSAPDAWAKKCVDEFGADMIVLQLKSTDPNGQDRSADEAAKVAKKVIDAVDVPVVLWGTANNQKDEEVLKKISESNEGKNVGLSPVEEGNHKGIGASAMGYGHTVVASSPIDVNLAKQLNILLGNLGLPLNKIIIDPTTGGLGYGLEYSYSVMERIRMAALTQEDDKLQAPMICNVGNEVWKSKEAGLGIEEAPTLGDPEKRAILMESVAAVCYLLGGADILILRHPESVRMTRSFIDLMINGGMASDVADISKTLEMQEADLLALSPEPDLDFGKAEKAAEKKPAKPKKAEAKAAPAPKKEAAPEAEKPKEKVVDLKPKDEKKAEEKPKAQEEPKAKAEEEAKAKAKAEEEAKVKAKEEAEAKAEKEAKARAEEKARVEKAAKAKEKADLEALRRKRAQKKKKEAKSEKDEKAPKAAPEELELVDRLALGLKRWHKRG